VDWPPATVIGAQVVGARAVTGGYTHNLRRVLTLDDGRTVFMKRAVDQETAEWLRMEWSVYQALGPAPFLAAVVAWEDEPLPTLVLEDLSAATWPPPWTAIQIDALLATLASIHEALGPQAGQPVIPHAPRVRSVQLDQLRIALPWAARSCGLPPPE